MIQHASGPQPEPQRSPLRRALLLLYAPVRPVARPLAHRIRRFFTGPLLDELADMRVRQEALMARQEMMLLRMDLLEAKAAVPPACELGAAGERLLLSLALERGPER